MYIIALTSRWVQRAPSPVTTATSCRDPASGPVNGPGTGTAGNPPAQVGNKTAHISTQIFGSLPCSVRNNTKDLLQIQNFWKERKTRGVLIYYYANCLESK